MKTVQHGLLSQMDVKKILTTCVLRARRAVTFVVSTVLLLLFLSGLLCCRCCCCCFFFTFFFSALQFFFSYVCPGVKKYPQLTDYNIIIVFLFKTSQRVQRLVNKPRYFHFPNPYQKSAVD